MSDFRFSTEVTVRFAETDAQGVAHNANYLIWFEVARVNYLEHYGVGYKSIQQRGFEALTSESHIRYIAPVHFDDRLTVHARCGDVRGARFRYDYVVTRDGQAVADGWTQHAVVDRGTMRPTRVPDFFAAAVASAESPP